ncbi:MAG: hypothetical protein ACRC8F_09155 [Cetobacterium sp.]
MAHYKEPTHMFLKRVITSYELFKRYLGQGREEDAEKAYEAMGHNFLQIDKYCGPWKSKKPLNLDGTYDESQKQQQLDIFLLDLDDNIELIRQRIKKEY